MGAIIGFIVGLTMWMIVASKAKGTSTVEALGPNPPLQETIQVAHDSFQILQRLRESTDKTHFVEPASTPDAILIRRPTSSASYGYAFLIRTAPAAPGGTQLLIHAAPLANVQKKVMPKHYAQFRTYLDQALR